MLRLLTLLFALIRWMGPFGWLIAFGLTWWGYVRWVHEPRVGHIAWGVAACIALLSLLGRATGYILFIPAARATPSAGGQGPLTRIIEGYAAGDVRARNASFFGVETDAQTLGMEAQVRWVDRVSPPHLAVLAPADLSPTLSNPSLEAGVWSLWYPGSRVRTGWIYTAGQKRFGLELSFLGRRLLLALEDEADVEQVQYTLENARP